MDRKGKTAVLVTASVAGLLVGAAARVALKVWLLMLAVFAAAVGASALALRKRPGRESAVTSS